MESNHVERAINVNDGGSDSLGLCQIKLETAKGLGYGGNAASLQRSAKINTHFAAKYLRFQLDRYDGSVWRGIAAYNSGTYKVDKSGTAVNKSYVDKVFKAWAGIR